MPTTYTHDAFGKKVYRQLPGQVQRVIRENSQLYLIGLHGPDILFYYGLNKNYVNQTGVRLHNQIAWDFFSRGIEDVRQQEDEELLAYLLGFACHYMLDSTCHPYVYSIEKKVAHTVIEKEMDRQLMIKDGKDPLTYFPARTIVPSLDNAITIQKMFPELTCHQIVKALSGMRRSTALMIYGNGHRQKVILPLLKLCGKYHELGDHFMRKTGDSGLASYLDILEGLYQRAIEETPAILTALYESVLNGSEIPQRFCRNYK